MPSTKHRYGWVRDIPDQRDHLYAAPVERLRDLPRQVTLRAQCPDIYDQGQLGSCTGNGIAAAVQFERLKANQQPDFVPSRLFIYYNERVMEETVDVDSGAMIRDGIKSVAKAGVCKEQNWPYVITAFTAKPSPACYDEALQYRVTSYRRLVQNLNQMKGCLADGYPFVFGFTVYESFESTAVEQTGVVPMPAPSEVVLGGHCVVAVGYDDDTQCFLVRNSWGKDWGDKGYCTMPYALLTDPQLASDFWTIRLITN
jgi:C1A family cysteine protease